MDLTSLKDIVISGYQSIGLFNIAMFLIACVSLVFAYSSREKKRLVYTQKTISLIHDEASEYDSLSIKFRGSEVKDLALTRIALWNSGNKVIEKSDLAPKDPLKIETKLDNASLYSVKIVHVTASEQNIVLQPIYNDEGKHEQNKILLDFDFINPREGLLLQVLHTGADKDTVHIAGSVKGYGKVNRIDEYFTYLLPEKNYLKKLSLSTRKKLAALLLFISPVIVAVAEYHQAYRDFSGSVIFFAALITIYWFAAVLVLLSRTPRKLEKLMS